MAQVKTAAGSRESFLKIMTSQQRTGVLVSWNDCAKKLDPLALNLPLAGKCRLGQL